MAGRKSKLIHRRMLFRDGLTLGFSVCGAIVSTATLVTLLYVLYGIDWAEKTGIAHVSAQLETANILLRLLVT